jgi:hypothetical protein
MKDKTPSSFEQLIESQTKLLTNVSASIIEMRANTDAVITLLLRYSERLGVSSEQLLKEYRDLARSHHAKRLEQAEDIDPWAAGLIDQREIEGLEGDQAS